MVPVFVEYFQSGCMESLITKGIRLAIWGFFSLIGIADNSIIQGGYDFLVERGLLEDRGNVRSYLRVASELIQILKKGLVVFKEVNRSHSTRVEAALDSLERLDVILNQNRHNCVQREVQKIKKIYSDLKSALNSMKVKIDNRILNKSSRAMMAWFLQQWATISEVEQLKAIEDKIKDAVQKGTELTILSTLVGVNSLHILQNFNTHRTWLVPRNAVNPPSPPQLHFEEKPGNIFMLTWERVNDDEDIDFFEVCYDEDQCLSMGLNGDMYKTEIGSPTVVPGIVYTMKIRGINEGGEGEWSNSVKAQFIRPTPRKPDPPKLHMVSTSAVAVTVFRPKLLHESESPVGQWNVQYSIDGHNGWTTENHRVNEFTRKNYTGGHTFVIENLIPRQRYHFRVQVINADGESDFSQPVSIKMEYKSSLVIAGQVALALFPVLTSLVLYLFYYASY